MVGVPDRSAMYYPRIHFPDLEWTKATLLSFGRVHRIVPRDHPRSKDPPEISANETWDEKDPTKVIVNVDPEHQDIELAQAGLFHRLQNVDTAALQARFGKVVAGDSYEIHRSKVHDPLFDLLEQHGLTWKSERNYNAQERFYSIHPQLGEAIMGVSAIRTARRVGSDIVTNEPTLHNALAAADEMELLHSIFDPAQPLSAEVAADRASAQLAHAVLITRFDLSKVPMDAIVGMALDGTDLRGFRKMLLELADQIPPELDQTARDQRIEALTEQVLEAWNELERRLPASLKSTFKEALTSAGDDLASSAATAVVTTGVAAAATALTPVVVLGAIAGFAAPLILKLFRTARATKREADEPHQFRFLSQITKHGGSVLEVPRAYRSSLE